MVGSLPSVAGLSVVEAAGASALGGVAGFSVCGASDFFLSSDSLVGRYPEDVVVDVDLETATDLLLAFSLLRLGEAGDRRVSRHEGM